MSCLSLCCNTVSYVISKSQYVSRHSSCYQCVICFLSSPSEQEIRLSQYVHILITRPMISVGSATTFPAFVVVFTPNLILTVLLYILKYTKAQNNAKTSNLNDCLNLILNQIIVKKCTINVSYICLCPHWLTP